MRAALLAVWAALAATVILGWVGTRRSSLALSRVVGAIGSRRVGWVLLLLGWAWLGWHFLAR